MTRETRVMQRLTYHMLIFVQFGGASVPPVEQRVVERLKEDTVRRINRVRADTLSCGFLLSTRIMKVLCFVTNEAYSFCSITDLRLPAAPTCEVKGKYKRVAARQGKKEKERMTPPPSKLHPVALLLLILASSA